MRRQITETRSRGAFPHEVMLSSGPAKMRLTLGMT